MIKKINLPVKICKVVIELYLAKKNGKMYGKRLNFVLNAAKENLKKKYE